mgnify:CR=1 FL=1
MLTQPIETGKKKERFFVPLRLIDTDIEVLIEISGTKITVKPLTQGNKLRLSFMIQKLQHDINSGMIDLVYDMEINTLLAAQIVAIEDPRYAEWNKNKILAGMDYDDKADLISELLKISSINEDERKN